MLQLAHDEDLGPDGRDITAEVIADARGNDTIAAEVVARAQGVLAVLAAADDIADVFGGVRITPLVADGQTVAPGSVVARVEGSRSAVVRGERTLLNLLGRLSGVATITAAYVRAAQAFSPPNAHSPRAVARVFDTRKTTPGLRVLEKYAVRCGGGCCHRLGLHDAVLIKDNHITGLGPAELAARVEVAAARARELGAAFVEVEVDTSDQFAALLTLPTGTLDIVLLDNMPPQALAAAAMARDAAHPALLLEASGGVRLETIGEIAATGVDRVSVGALTHQAVGLDLGLDIP